MAVEIQRRGRADKTKREREKKKQFWGNAQNARCQEGILKKFQVGHRKNIKYLDKNMENRYNENN